MQEFEQAAYYKNEASLEFEDNFPTLKPTDAPQSTKNDDFVQAAIYSAYMWLGILGLTCFYFISLSVKDLCLNFNQNPSNADSQNEPLV